VSVSLIGQGISHDTGGAGSDTFVSIENLTGSGFSDFLGGDGGDNLLSGLAGDDGLDGGAGNDTLDGGTGNDTATYQDAADGVTVSLAITTAQDTHSVGLDTLVSIENLTGTAFDDTLTGDAGANLLSGATGNDTLEGGAGNDMLDGGDGTDTLEGGAGNDLGRIASSSTPASERTRSPISHRRAAGTTSSIFPPPCFPITRRCIAT
jgi:Ca2+-binding RTX toxin-like protein